MKIDTTKHIQFKYYLKKHIQFKYHLRILLMEIPKTIPGFRQAQSNLTNIADPPGPVDTFFL